MMPYRLNPRRTRRLCGWRVTETTYVNALTQWEATMSEPNPWAQSYEDYLSDEPGAHGIPDGLTREEYEQARRKNLGQSEQKD